MRRCTLAGALSVGLIAAASGAASADVLACYADGNAAMKAGDFEAAAEAFAAARTRRSCDPARDGLLFNEAAALDKLAEKVATPDDDRPYCRALYAYRRALEKARDATRPAIDAAIDRLSRQCPPAGALRVVCGPAGGTVAVQGVKQRRSCPALFADLRPGTHRGEVITDGRKVPFEVQVPSGRRVEHRVAVEAVEAVGPAEPVAPPGEPGPSLAPWAWTAIGLGVAAAGVATYAYVGGLSAVDDLEGLNGRHSRSEVTQAEYDARYADLSDQYETAQVLHLGGVIAAGALLTTGAVLWVLDPGEQVTVEPVVGAMSGVRVRWGP